MSILDGIIALYAPHCCLGCGYDGSILCEACGRQLRLVVERCHVCHEVRPLGKVCASCRPQTGLVSLNSVVAYSGVAKDLIWRLKFERAQAAADVIAREMVRRYAALTPRDALIVPVPTAMKRVRQRGYDQAVIIAKSYARQTGCQYAPLLERHGSQEQKQAANRKQRHEQIKGAFSIRKPKKLQGRRVLLIDDVVTSGATFESAASTLRRHGAVSVGALSFARV